MIRPLSLELSVELLEALADQVAKLLEERTAPERPPWLDANGAADYLGWPKQRLYKLTSAGAIPHRRHGNRLLFSPAELDAWLEDFREGPPLRPASGGPMLDRPTRKRGGTALTARPRQRRD